MRMSAFPLNIFAVTSRQVEALDVPACSHHLHLKDLSWREHSWASRLILLVSPVARKADCN